MSEIPLVDTHVHFWDLSHPTLTYEWLGPATLHPILGDISAIKSVKYGLQDFIAESRFAGVAAAVHVQAAVGTSDPVEETRWVEDVAGASPIPMGIVAGASLSGEDVAQQLERHLKSPHVRGVRDYGREDYLDDPAFHRGVAELAARGLVLDLDCPWQDMPKALALARENPELTVVLEHIGYPRDTSSLEYFEAWRQGISLLAASENVYCKISGLGMNRRGWTAGELRPWVAHCIEQFTPSRCMWGSNWPVDRLYGSYDAYALAFRHLIATYSLSEQQQMANGVARSTYRLEGSH
jgi:predicted TIM-barrel fold metal-dependent hydrolase